MKLTIERAAEADADALLEAQIAAFHDDTRLYGVPLGGPPGYTDIDRLRRSIREDAYYKIVYDGRIVGGIGLYDEGHHVHIDVLYIHPDYHNLGIGTRTMQFVEAAYPAARTWTLNTPTYATRNQHFYEKFGYLKYGEHFLEEDDITLIDYRKQTENAP
jgi:GNAT superfamily N-acetyltransferase